MSVQMLITLVVHNLALTTHGLEEQLEEIGQERLEEIGSTFVDKGKPFIHAA